LIGASYIQPETLHAWLPQWRAAFEAVPAEKATPRLKHYRLNYYLRAFEAMLGSERPLNMLWPLVLTWTQASRLMPAEAPSLAAWREAAGELGLLGEAFYDRIAALDAYLDLVEETLDAWAQKNGILSPG
jgi:hypothetical protein